MISIALEAIDHPLRASVLKYAEESAANERTEELTRSSSRRSPRGPSDIVISSHFKMIFLAVLLITLGSGVAQTALAFSWPALSNNQQEVFAGLGFAWRAGIGAIFGLLGGRAA